MTTTDIVTSDRGTQQLLARSRRNMFFALWALAMRCLRGPLS